MLENNEEKVENPVTEEQNNASKETENAVNEVENEVANESEKADEKHEIPMLEYASMELEKLVDELKKLLKDYPVQQLKSNVDALKTAFNSKFGALLAKKKEAFYKNGKLKGKMKSWDKMGKKL